MSYEMSHAKHGGGGTRVGGRPFNHDQSREAEEEYDRLRDLARQEASKRGNCYERSKEAYNNGDGAAAKALSNEGKAHGERMEQYNKQASEFIFRENNATDRVPADTIDLHGQFVEEAEDILEERIKYARSTGQRHLHVIVGKGNHSQGHIQKIKPRVEQVCRELALDYRTEPNEGRIYIDLSGGKVDMGAANNWQSYQQGSAYGGHQQQQSGGYPGQPHGVHQQQQQPHYQQQSQQQQQQEGGGSILSTIFRALIKCLGGK
ncbi:hypothetical protein LTR70_006111 [Exophiala xenobiotica]|uniref:Smr domain-containing protein n=1 Tax=Lithohypha guttulata TaxID=1690604 RepID=A0ABR0K8P6_9EURO|nr:hypothetical protein LTR24_005652 [Lithohypha guttulata]KAK5316864.1 hypothetical protein LTR70_006111 [Exophiala xenobiotica]